mmetsp:Transcript_48476/g.75711  ORF Transcript_48476/g.75711 Transcript_48476/m.75711 type:complete len:381 (-) Transcript_48476:79-1221(-)
MRNGAIVSLVDGEICPDHSSNKGGLYMVVSDNNAKWKGEPIPTPDEELHGHWCAFLGQVPVVVEGKVSTGDHISPKCNGSGIGIVSKLGDLPVIGVALMNKSDPTPGIIKTLVFAGLNAMHRSTSTGSDQALYKELLQQNVTNARKIEILEENVIAIENNVAAIHEKVGESNNEVATLNERLSIMERFQFWNSRAKTKEPDLEEHGEVSAVLGHAVPTGVPVSNTGIPGINLHVTQNNNGDGGGWSKAFLAAIAVCILVIILAIVLAVVLPPILEGDPTIGTPAPPEPAAEPPADPVADPPTEPAPGPTPSPPPGGNDPSTPEPDPVDQSPENWDPTHAHECCKRKSCGDVGEPKLYCGCCSSGCAVGQEFCGPNSPATP